MTVPLGRVRTLTVTLLVLTLILTGLVAVQVIATRELRASTLQRCLNTSRANEVNKQARIVEVHEFRTLAALARVNFSLPEAQQIARQQSYLAMAEALQKAVDSSVPINDCERFR